MKAERVVAGNDSLEMVEWGDVRPNYMTHNKDMLDQRADWTLRLLSSWGAAGTIADTIAKIQFEGQPHKKSEQLSPQDMVMRICEVVDAAWNEMQHRGWIVKTGSLG